MGDRFQSNLKEGYVPKYKLFIDLDGVLADFDKAVLELTGKAPDRDNLARADKDMWKAIDLAGTFYRDLDLMPDAMELWGHVKDHDPTILSGIPLTRGASEQKRQWCAEHLGPDAPVITCASKDKIHKANEVTYVGWTPVLVDDWTKHRQVWIDNGGIFIHHTSAADSIRQLEELGL